MKSIPAGVLRATAWLGSILAVATAAAAVSASRPPNFVITRASTARAAPIGGTTTNR